MLYSTTSRPARLSATALRASKSARQRVAAQMLAALSPRARKLFVSQAGPAAWARLCFEAGTTVSAYAAPLEAAPQAAVEEATRALRALVTARA